MAEEGDRQAQPLLPAVAKPGSTADAQTTRGSVDRARRSMERANYESCTSAASQNVTKIRADPHRSRMDQEPVTLSWENVNVFVREKKKKKKQKGVLAEDGAVSGVVAETSAVKNGLKQIISNVSGVVKPGTLLAILGASGAGKSTLMNVLTNRNLNDYILEGSIKVNGMSIGSGIRNISAYVQQDDLFISTLTVRETLIFRAMLRMDQRIKIKARMERVEEVIQEMGLSKCADTQIGKADMKKGISGGESKRLSVACEMLTNPALLFCDEPTSGLDSFMAQTIVQTLQSMAQKNHTILCTIHQPSSEIFAMFDRILLLAEGHVAFMGESAQAIEFFRSLNYMCPTNFNPADFFILTLAIQPGKEEECQKKVHAICDSFSDTPQAKEIKRSIDEISAGAEDPVLKEKAVASESRFKASWCQQFISVLWRCWISLMRNVILFRIRAVQTIIVSVILGLIYLRLEYNQKGVMNINGGIFLLITNASFTNMFAVINSFPHELPVFMREYGSGLYRTDAYYLAKTLAELPTFVILPFIFISIDYWMMGLYDTWQAYLIAAGIIILVSNVAVSFGLLISTLSGDVNLALAIAPPIMVPFMMFGGFFLNSDSVPVYFIWMNYLSWFKYANEILSVNQWHDVTKIACEANSTCQYKNGADVLRYLSFSADNKWEDLGLLFALFAGFRLVSFVALLIRARRSKT